jgi:PAT family beta-lactamase induction signal transducer AmpG
MSEPSPTHRSPWAWIPTLYLAEGLPYVLVMTVAGIMYKGLGVSNKEIALYTSLLYLPWVLKPLWSPVVDMLKTRRLWIWSMQLLVGAGLVGVALGVHAVRFLPCTLIFFGLVALGSATHDIAADGFYMLATTEREQASFSGVRNTCYRLATICGQGLLVIVAGKLIERTNDTPLAWSVAFAAIAGVLVSLALHHRFILPRPVTDRPVQMESAGRFYEGFFETFAAFFKKPKIASLLLFLLFYRFAEAQLVKMVGPFLLDAREKGGLGLTTTDVGVVYGTVGVVALMLGGIIGGVLVSRRGLRAWFWPMALIMHLPDAVFVYLAWAQPASLEVINCCVAVEQFGYGFGFTAYMLYMIYIARGEHRTAHYAICTGFMALGMMLPGMFSGWLQETLGYRLFFVWVMLATIPGFIVVRLVPLDPEFGRRAST